MNVLRYVVLTGVPIPKVPEFRFLFVQATFTE